MPNAKQRSIQKKIDSLKKSNKWKCIKFENKELMKKYTIPINPRISSNNNDNNDNDNDNDDNSK